MAEYIEPLKHLEVSPFIHEMRNRLLAFQQKEYDKNTLAYLVSRQPSGKPFDESIEDFSGQPDQIIQIKNLSNALFLAEQVFEQLQKLNFSDRHSIIGIWKIREIADEASYLLLNLGTQFEGAFKQEIATILSYLTKVHSLTESNIFDPTAISMETFSLDAGKLSGYLIDQMKPASGKLDYDLVTWFSGVLPTYIEQVRVGIETSAANSSFIMPNVDEEKMAEVVHKKLDKLSNSIKHIINTVGNIKDPMSLITHLPALFAIPNHFKQMQPLMTEILQEVDHLEDTVQNLIHEYLAKLKYEALPNLFSLVDKFESQMLLEPGRLSSPLMDQIKPLHDMLIQTSRNYLNVKFTGKAEHLLKLEDTRFIELRLAPIHQQVDESKRVLHLIELTLAALDVHLQLIDENQDNLAVLHSKETLKTHFTLLKPYLELLDDKSRQSLEKHLTAEPTLQSNTKNWLSSWFETPDTNPARPALNKLKLHLEQMQTDQNFRLNRNNELIESVHSKANIVLFEHNKTNNIFDISEKEAFVHRHSLSDDVQFDNNGTITNPEQLTDDEAWDLYQWYDNKLTDMNRAEQNCDHLMTVLKAKQKRNVAQFKTSTIAFHPDYIPCLLEDKEVRHQPNCLYVNIEGANLKYEVLEPPKKTACSLLKMSQVDPHTLDTTQLSALLGNHDGFIQYRDNVFYFDTIKLNFVPPENIPRLRPIINALPEDKLRIVDGEDPDFETIASEDIRAVCKLYLMQLDEAKKAGYRDCYVWNREIKQLSYIDENGRAQDKITLSAKNKSMLRLFIKKNNLPRIKEFDRRRREVHQVTNVELDDSNYLNLTAGNIANFNTPVGLIRTGTIPLTELNCPLTQLASITALKPYLPRVFDKVLERGHIHDQEHSECLRCYSSIQPYLVDAFKEVKIKDIQTFDKDVVNVFSGHVYNDTSKSRKLLSFDDFRPQLLGLKNELPGKQRILRMKRDQYFEQVRNKVFSVESRPIKTIYHTEFSPDVANFMLSIEPVKRQIHESGKTVFRVKLALEHLDKYCKKQDYSEASLNQPEQNLQNKHYPWFHKFLAQRTKNLKTKPEISTVTAEQLKTHLKQILFYEKAEIKRNKLIVESFNPRVPHPAKPCDLSEATAFMHLIHDTHPFTPCLMKQGHELEPGQLHIKIVGRHLHYKLMHYGKPLSGKIALNKLTPALSHFDDKTKLSKKSISNIMSIAYDRRKRQIESDNALISSEEALDLYQWYRTIQDDKEDLSHAEQTSLENKLDIYEKRVETKSPELNIEPEQKIKKTAPHDNRANYLIKHKKCGAALTELKQIVTNLFDNLTDSFKQELQQPSYVLELMPEHSPFQQGAKYLKSLASYVVKMPKDSELKQGVLYLKDIGKAGLQYMVKRNQNEDGILGTINAKELAAIGITLPLSKDGLIEQLKPKIADMLNILSLRRHTPFSESPFPNVGTGTSNDFYVGIFNIVFSWINWTPLSQKKRLEDLVMDGIAALPNYSKPGDNAKLPWPLKHAVNVTLPWALDSGVNVTLPWVFDCVESYIKNSVSPFESKEKTYSPHQVLAYKRLMNIIYYLEQIMLEVEKVNADESKLSRLNHLLISYLHLADIYPLIGSLLADPHFSPFFRDIISRVESIIKNITDEGEHYSVPDQVKADANPVNLDSLYFMNVLKMLPERISLSTNAYKDKLPELKASSKKATANIEKIIHDYHASFASLRLFFDLPIVFGLLNELPKNVTNFAHKINKRIKDDLGIAPPDFLLKIIMEADALELTMGLESGTISDPLKKILDEFYKGLITPLILDVDKQVSLLCDPAPMRKRIFTTSKRALTANLDSKKHEQASTSMQHVLDSCNGSRLQLNDIYRTALPLFKNALNGSNIYVMSFNDAKKAKHKDCFVWDDNTSQLFYIDSKGNPNPQDDGCELYLRSIPVNKPLTEKALLHTVAMSVPGVPIDLDDPKKNKLMVSVKKPTLIKHGDKYFIYDHSAGTGWTFTELDSGIVSKMHLDFNNTKLLHRNKDDQDMYKDYRDMYAEITAKTGWTYPIHLKNNHKFIEFITQKTRQNGANHTPTYLSESEIKKFISSNSNFALQKNGVSLPNAVGCCFISMSTIPETFDNLKLPLDYNAYYVQVKGVNDVLYFIDRKTKSIKHLDIIDIPNKQNHFIKKMSTVRKNKLMLNTDFNTIQSLTGHVYQPDFISNLDEFVPNEQNISQLKALAIQCKDHYKGLHATSQLAAKATLEQLDSLREREREQKTTNNDIKQSVFTDYFNKKMDELCNETDDLLGSPRLASEYQAKLKAELSTGRDLIIEKAKNSDSKSIDNALKDAKAIFDENYLKQYRQLNAINTALDDFMLYLNVAEKQWLTRQSVFESAETIRGKRNTIDHLNALAANENDELSVRIKKIQTYLIEDATLDHLLSYSNYESNSFAMLCQLVLRFFEAVGLYTPKVVQHVDKLLSALEGPTAPERPKGFLFFAEPTRTNIRTRVDRLNANDEEPKPKPPGSNSR